jgi:formylglycine-generating enzyme required for sulfatase activity
MRHRIAFLTLFLALVAITWGDPSTLPGTTVTPMALKALQYLQRVDSTERRDFDAAQRSRARDMAAEIGRLYPGYAMLTKPDSSAASYIRQIELLSKALADIDSRYAKVRQEGLSDLGALHKTETEAALAGLSLDPWENDAEYAVRRAGVVASMEARSRGEPSVYERALGAEIVAVRDGIAALLATERSTLGSTDFTIGGPDLRVTVGSFDRNAKTWPITVESTDPAMPFRTEFEHSIKGAKDLSIAWRAFTTVIDTGALAVRIEYCLVRPESAGVYKASSRTIVLYNSRTGEKLVEKIGTRRIFDLAPSEPDKRLFLSGLHIESAIAGTTVKLDGRDLGDCPMDITVEPGEHSLVFSWEYAPGMDETRTIRLGYGTAMTVAPEVSSGELVLSGLPETARAKIGGWMIPGERATLRSGHYTVTVAMEGYRQWFDSFDIGQDERYLAPVEMKEELVPMVVVEGGSFDVGSDDSKHRVAISQFYIGKCEVTQGQYSAVMGYSPSVFSSGDDAPQRPVEQVSWYDAVEFCNKLSVKEGYTPVYTLTGRDPASGYSITSATVTQDMTKNGYRLPTEAEWEYAARGGNGSPGGYTYSGSNDIGAVAWYDGNSGNTTHAVGTKAVNGLGLYDMSGNVWEWCQDRYGSYGSGSQSDPMGASSGGDRVPRGGSWGHDADYCRSALRISSNPGYRGNGVGFRVARRP